MENKAYWAIKNVNLDLDVAGRNRFLQLNKLAEMRHEAYEHSRSYKERTKRWHDARITDKEFQEGEEVLVFNSRLKIIPGKLRTRWYGPYSVTKVFPYGTVEVFGKNGIRFKDTNEELDEQELEAHYKYMAKIQEVLHAIGDNSGPTYDAEPLEKVDSNIILDSSDMCNNDIKDGQNAKETKDERVLLASLITNLKLDVDKNKEIYKK
nr:hypothetical protein [Tanacetum cinerariifolium]